MQHALHIIVADDDPALAKFYRDVCLRLGHEVCVAHTGNQLVEQRRLLRPDLVLAGANLPDLDGITAAEEVCRDQPTPIILVADDRNAESVQRALADPYVLACLFKPLKEADLGAAITVVMRRFEQFESLRKEVADLRQALEDRKFIERAKGLVMKYVGLSEEEAYQRLKRMASRQNRKLVEIAQAVLTAGEVFQQLEQRPEGETCGNGRARNNGMGQRPVPARTLRDGRRVLPSPAPLPQDGQATG